MSMKKQILPLIFLLIAFSFFIYTTAKRPKIMIVNSYSKRFLWEIDLEKGISSVTNKRKYLNVKTLYMHGKEHQEQAYLRSKSQLIRKIVRKWHPNVLIASDDIAQKWVAKHFTNDNNISIVFLGVNADISMYGYQNASNVTGIVERLPFVAIKEVLANMVPNKKRIAHISDNSFSAQFVAKRFNTFNWKPLQLVTNTIAMNDYKTWQKKVLSLQDKVDIIFVSHYETFMENGRPVPSERIVKWLMSNSKVPVIGLYGFFVQQGGAFAIASPIKKQGEMAAKLALKLIDGKTKASNYPVQRLNTFDIYIRQEKFDKMFTGIKLPLSYLSLAQSSDHYYP